MNQAIRLLALCVGMIFFVACHSTPDVRNDVVQNEAQAEKSAEAAPSSAQDEAPAETADAARVAVAKPETVAETVAETEEDEANLTDITRCEAKIDYAGSVYTGESLAPTIEEARDGAIEEACAVPCAEDLSEKDSEKEREDKLEACIDKCTYASIAIAAQCWKDGVSVYTEGAWSDTNDAAPTNGEESPDPMRQ